MRSVIEGFIKSMAADGKSEHTIDAYKRDLAAFADTMNTRPLRSIEYRDLREWADGLAADGLAASSRARKVSAVKSFFRYCCKMEIIGQNPADGLETPKIEHKEPKTIASEDTKALLEKACDGHKKGGDGVLWFRNYAILLTFLLTGVRREELTNIKLADVDIGRGSILVHGKGAKERFVYINETLLAVMSEYMEVYRGRLKYSSESPYLFPSTMSEKMSLKTVNNIVNKAFEAAGIKEPGISAHTLRKRFATSVFNNTSDIATVSKMLGHSSPTVTMRYVVVDESRIKNAVSTLNF